MKKLRSYVEIYYIVIRQLYYSRTSKNIPKFFNIDDFTISRGAASIIFEFSYYLSEDFFISCSLYGMPDTDDVLFRFDLYKNIYLSRSLKEIGTSIISSTDDCNVCLDEAITPILEKYLELEPISQNYDGV